MSRLVNYDNRPKREVIRNERGEELIKNQFCIGCKKLFTCKGKPRSVKDCLNYEERTDRNGYL